MKFLVRCSLLWAGLLILGSGMVWGGKKGKNVPAEEEPVILSLSALNMEQTSQKRKHTASFTDMKDLKTDYVESANLAKDKVGGKISGTAKKKAIKGMRLQKGKNLQKYPNKKSTGTSVYKYKPESKVCGNPICAEVDMIPKRFRSLCSMAKWMKHNGHTNRVFMVQKQDCAKIIDDGRKGYKFKGPWGRNTKRGGDKACQKDEGCNTEICINDNGLAKTFVNVFQAYKYLNSLGRSPKTNAIAVALGKCSDVYEKGCINTEWFDLDDPNSDDVEEESVPYAHQLVINSDPKAEIIKEEYNGKDGKVKVAKKMGKMHRGIHRSCPPTEMEGGAQFMTTSGESPPLGKEDPGRKYSKTELKLECKSHDNKQKIGDKFSWDEISKNVTCRDWKVRYCCKDMWGETFKGRSDKPKKQTEVIMVDKPERGYLFEECDWKKITSTRPLNDTGSDDESKLMKLDNKMKKVLKGESKKVQNYCKGFALGTRFIDVRTNDEQSLPYDEVKDQNILKVSPVFGFICKGKNCKDYNVRYCCIKNAKQYGKWGSWGPWSGCDQECGGGVHVRTRKCDKGEGKCYAASDNAEKQERPCNLHPCSPGVKGARTLSKFSSWGDCSVSCGKGTRRRARKCTDPKGCGKEPLTEEGSCNNDPCPIFEWGEWSQWVGCKFECGKVQHPIRARKCYEKIRGDKNPHLASLDDCGDEKNSKETRKDPCIYRECDQDGGWSDWSPWSGCAAHCMKKRTRECNNPEQRGKGKPCKGPSFEEEKCQLKGGKKQKCQDAPCVYSAWGEWSSCFGLSCGSHDDAAEAIRERHRHVLSGKDMESCKKMGVGVKEIGQCVHCNPIPSDRLKEKPGKYCLKDCPRDCEYGQWGEWQGDNHCLYCIRSDPSNKDPKEMTRTRAVKKEAIGGGEPCDKKIETVSCESIKTKEKCKDVKVEHWSDWSSCIIPPEKGAGKGPLKTNCHSVKGKQTRTRRCKKQGCKEKLEESKDCLTICKSTEPFEKWSEWSECKGLEKEENGEKCGTGQKTRKRKCQKWIKKDPKALEKFCFGEKEQHDKEDCGFGPCGQEFIPLALV